MEKRVVGLPWISRPDHCSKFKYPKNKELGNGGRPSGRPRGERMRSGGGLVGSPTESTLCVRHSNRMRHLYCVPLSPCMHHTPRLSFLEWSETLKGGLYGCSVKKTDFANIVKFGHFWGGIAAKICICAKKCSIFGLLWVRTSKKNLCQPSDPWAFWGVVNYMLGSKFTL